MNNKISFKIIVQETWKSKLLIFIIFAIFLFISSLYLRFTTYEYTVSFQVVPANNIKNENVLDSLGGNFAGIASFVGLPRGDKDNNDFELFKSLFKSRTIAETLIKDQNILISMFPDYWDNEKNEWKKPTKSFFFKF